MKIWIPVLISRLHEESHPETDGFYDGSHQTPVEHGVRTIEGKFDERKAEYEKTSIANQKAKEAEKQYLQSILPEVERRWNGILDRLGESVPNVVWPLAMLAIGVLALASETLMLAPALDVLGIAEAVAQMVAALGISCVAALAFHYAWESFSTQRRSRAWCFTWRVLASVFAFALTAWGILRGLQVAFAAKIAENPLSEFLGNHPILSSIFFVFVTLATPIIAAGASNYAIEEVQRWWEWKSVKARRERSIRQLAKCQKAIETEMASLKLGLEGLDQARKTKVSNYVSAWTRGATHGSIQESYWVVPAKASFAAMCALFFAGWAMLLYPFAFLLPFIVWWAAFLYYRREWRSPSRNQFFDLENVKFATHSLDAADSNIPLKTFGETTTASRKELHP